MKMTIMTPSKKKKKKKDDKNDIHGKKKTKKMQAGMLASKYVFNI